METPNGPDPIKLSKIQNVVQGKTGMSVGRSWILCQLLDGLPGAVLDPDFNRSSLLELLTHFLEQIPHFLKTEIVSSKSYLSI